MPLTVIFVAAVILAVWVMYDSGNLMSEKVKLQNTADNVAYSTATLMARDLNFVAYTNRAMVANQVSIAQFVGISSWLAMARQFASNVDAIGDVLRYIPYIGPVIEALTETLERSIDGISAGYDTFASEAIRLTDDIVVPALSRTQAAYHIATMGLIAEYGPEIAELNDPHAQAVGALGDYGLVEAGTAIQQWSEQIGGQNELPSAGAATGSEQRELQRFREFEGIVADSRDPFSKGRSYGWPSPFHGRFALGFGELEWETRKYGGTDFIRETGTSGEYRWSWAAMDNVSLWAKACTRVPILGCVAPPPPPFSLVLSRGFQEVIPLGWGAGHALRADRGPGGRYFRYGGSRADVENWGDGSWRNPLAASLTADLGHFGQLSDILGGFSPLEDHSRNNLAYLGGGTGPSSSATLRPFYAFRTDEKVDFGPAIIAVYGKSDESIPSQETLIEGAGGVVAEELDADKAGSLIHGRLYAAAKARPYFTRPTDLSQFARLDGRYEHGNLFNPFWQARLVDFSETERTAISLAATQLDLSE